MARLHALVNAGSGRYLLCVLRHNKRKAQKAGLLIKGLVGSTFVTGIEFIFGVVFNIILKKNVWDYSKMPMNIGGQICMPYSCLWVLLSLVCIPFAGKVKKQLGNNIIKK